ncbi:S-adenosyl-L-methionine-dependent methyltransferase, partial [Diaporthe sp. PMI_573]
GLATTPSASAPTMAIASLMTGTGNWAIDFADKFPMCDVLGTDLSLIQQQYVPANCRFELDDAEDEWNFRSPFDLIHTRASVLCWRDYTAFINQAYQALEPGGWLEMQEFNHRPVFYIRSPLRCERP